ncbi:MAG: hypothetical protein IJW65_04755 [Clostridia bacterium]|nr:hypothetical protein [Clostridia bacterium]
MKQFFDKYSYTAVKLFLNQIVIGIFFGVGFLFVANKLENPAFKIGASVLSIIFFLFLEYTVAYKLGTEERVSVDIGKAKADYLLPVKIWLLANSLNLLLALFITLGQVFSGVGFFGSVGGVCVTVAMIIEGMYSGLILLWPHWSMYFLITLPSLLVVFLSYVLGLKSKKIAKMFEFQYPESDRPETKSKKK